MAMRRSTPVFAALGGLALVFAGQLLTPVVQGPARDARIAEERMIVRQLGLSDPALFTEARYSRNPSLADLNTPFQDHPLGFDHFPSGTLVPLPNLPDSGRMRIGSEGVK